jgi:hypothetical protein
MQSVLIYIAALPLDADGMPDPAWVWIGSHPKSGQSAYHAPAGTAVPVGATVLISGATAWTWAELKALVPKGQWDRLGECWYNDARGRVRAKIADKPNNAAATEMDLPPHHFFGEL